MQRREQEDARVAAAIAVLEQDLLLMLALAGGGLQGGEGLTVGNGTRRVESAEMLVQDLLGRETGQALCLHAPGTSRAALAVTIRTIHTPGVAATLISPVPGLRAESWEICSRKRKEGACARGVAPGGVRTIV
jgi:hypothetical protein